MSEAKVEYEVALDMARRGREAFLEDPTSKTKFLFWRDASETAIKWHRALRLSGDESTTDDELEKLGIGVG